MQGFVLLSAVSLLAVYFWPPAWRHFWLSSRLGLGSWSCQCGVWSPE